MQWTGPLYGVKKGAVLHYQGRQEKIPGVLENLKVQLGHPAIKSVCIMADKRVAHVERFAEGSDPADRDL
jgi:hypothetical protein